MRGRTLSTRNVRDLRLCGALLLLLPCFLAADCCRHAPTNERALLFPHFVRAASSASDAALGGAGPSRSLPCTTLLSAAAAVVTTQLI